jgi:hypothetical protein
MLLCELLQHVQALLGVHTANLLFAHVLSLVCSSTGLGPGQIAIFVLSSSQMIVRSSRTELCFIAGWSWIKEVTRSNPVPVTRFLLFCSAFVGPKL